MDLAQYRKPYPGTQPDYLHALYVSCLKRAPLKPLVRIPQTLSEVTGPAFARERALGGACDLTMGEHGEAQGQRICVSGRVLDENGRPVTKTLVEVWQANAAGAIPAQVGPAQRAARSTLYRTRPDIHG